MSRPQRAGGGGVYVPDPDSLHAFGRPQWLRVAGDTIRAVVACRLCSSIVWSTPGDRASHMDSHRAALVALNSEYRRGYFAGRSAARRKAGQ